MQYYSIRVRYTDAECRCYGFVSKKKNKKQKNLKKKTDKIWGNKSLSDFTPTSVVSKWRWSRRAVWFQCVSTFTRTHTRTHTRHSLSSSSHMLKELNLLANRQAVCPFLRALIGHGGGVCSVLSANQNALIYLFIYLSSPPRYGFPGLCFVSWVTAPAF